MLMGRAKKSAMIAKKAVITQASKQKNAKLVSSSKKSSMTVIKTKTERTGQEWWKTMSTLYVKRFPDDDPTLTAGAKRNRSQHPHIAMAELDPSGRSKCKQCGELISPKGQLRMTLMLECEKGYRFHCTLHEQPCFWQHRESRNINYADVLMKPGVTAQLQEMIQAKFAARINSASSNKEGP
jgi:hypothetical protein